ncbi:IS3 family transposase [Corynebacterium durum]|uniref:IS3 family transposase n=1 Tax=Corynebacterium durum TaxID=61592 RepID=UPI0036F1C1A8
MRIYRDNRSLYGVRKIHHQLLHDGIRVARCTVIRFDVQVGLQGRGARQGTTHDQAESRNDASCRFGEPYL